REREGTMRQTGEAAASRGSRTVLSVLVIVATQAPVAPALGDAQEREASYLGTFEAYDAKGKVSERGKVFDDEFFKALQQKIDGRYENLQIVVSACHAGGFAEQALARLPGSAVWSVTTASDKDSCAAGGRENRQPTKP